MACPNNAKGGKTMSDLFQHNNFSDRIISAYYEAVDQFMSRPYVTAIDIGLKIKRGRELKRKVIRIHVMEKFAATHLDAIDAFPDNVGGVEIDVVQSNFANYGPPRSGQYIKDPGRWIIHDPLIPGISVGDGRQTGSVGMFVVDNVSNNACLLSCDHVIASSNFPGQGDEVIQPGSQDGTHKTVAELLRWDR